MKAIQVAILSAAVLSSTLWAMAPAFALGNCGPNRHRNAAGVCVYGGQNQDWCMRTHGHTATRYANGKMVCR